VCDAEPEKAARARSTCVANEKNTRPTGKEACVGKKHISTEGRNMHEAGQQLLKRRRKQETGEGATAQKKKQMPAGMLRTKEENAPRTKTMKKKSSIEKKA